MTNKKINFTDYVYTDKHNECGVTFRRYEESPRMFTEEEILSWTVVVIIINPLDKK